MLDSPLNRKYLSDYGYSKRKEWSCLFEHQVVHGRLPASVASPASCKSKCRHASDFKLTAKHDLGTRRCEGSAGRGLPGVGDTSGANAQAVRVLDVGGGSCALDQYFQAYLAPMFPAYRRMVTMSVDVGYPCAYHLICSEKGSLALTGSWYEQLPVRRRVSHAGAASHRPCETHVRRCV